MVLLFLGLVGLAFWIVSLVSRLNRAELRLEQLSLNAKETGRELERIHALIARLAAPETQPPSAAPAAEPARAVAPARVASPALEPAAQPPGHAPVAAHAAPTEDAWEVTVGGSWLNKIGVLVFVIGLALLVGYSMTHVGPAGRIAIGFAVSLTLLGGGVAMERHAEYRNYAYGLVAGGWAGTYFTTYAMRAVDAARVLDSDLVAIVCLSVVAAAMVWHSLRYRSQEVTALAYVVAFATLALTPLRAFSLIASVPLAVSVLVVAQRFTWPRIQVLGIVCTYGLYVLRGRLFGFGDLDPATFTPYAALAIYWLLFEAADLAAVRQLKDADAVPPPLFLLNAAGLVGSALLQLPLDTPVPLSTFLLISGAAYLCSAMLRARLMGRPVAGADAIDAAARGSYQGASALAAAFVAWAIELRFADTQRIIALLMEAELLFLSGLILRDWLIRGLGSAVALLAGVHAIWAIGGPGASSLAWSWAAQGPAGTALLTAVAWYANREWLRARQLPLLRHEWAYAPVATYLVVLIARAEFPAGYAGFAVFLFACVLLEAGLRRAREYRYHAYLVGAFSAMAVLDWFVGWTTVSRTVPSKEDAWIILGVSALVAYVAAWRVAPRGGGSQPDRRERVIATATTGLLGTVFVVVLEWMVVAPPYVAGAWAMTAAAIGLAGLRMKTSGVRWQVYPLLLLALLRAMLPVLGPDAASSIELASALMVIGLLYVTSVAVRGAMTHEAKAIADVEDAVRIALSLAASLSLFTLIYNEVRPTWVTLTWGVQAAGLLAAGFPTRERLLRLSGLAVLLACIARLFVFDLPQLEELARIISFVVLGAVLLAVSWIYTRYRDRIQKYL